jgi:hypothetical protein
VGGVVVVGVVVPNTHTPPPSLPLSLYCCSPSSSHLHLRVLEYNELTGSIPSELVKLTGLAELYVACRVLLRVLLIVGVWGVWWGGGVVRRHRGNGL